jgi:hypothetical protein
MGAPSRQVMSTVPAMGVVQPTRQRPVELVARAVDKAVLPGGLVRRRADRELGAPGSSLPPSVRGDSNGAFQDPAAGRPAGGFTGDTAGTSIREVAWTMAASRSRSDSFFVPCPTKA